MKVTMLVENSKSEEFKFLRSEDGMSMLLEIDNKKVLLDTGRGRALLYNAEKLGINIRSIDYLVLTNAYKDHSGGILKFLEINKKAKVYLKAEAEEKYLVQISGINFSFGINKKVFTKFIERIVFVEGVNELFKNVYIVGDILNTAPLALVTRRYMRKKYDLIEEDNRKHELFMIVRGEKGINIFGGCNNNGVISTLDTAKKFFPQDKINSFIGGMHFNGFRRMSIDAEPKDEVIRVIKNLKSYNIGKIYTCHCTGMKQFDILKNYFGEKVEYLSTGKELIL